MSQPTIQSSKPFWIDEKHEFISSCPTQSRNIHSEYDIIIIGTGISGVACAYWLRKLYPVHRFPRILLLEKNARPCSGASGRNAGFLSALFDHLSDCIDDLGYENSFAWLEFQQENLRAICDVVNENKIDCELNATRGHIALACNQKELETPLKCYELIKEYIKTHPKTKISLDIFELWDEKKCQEMLHSDKFIGGLFVHESGTIWTAKFVYGLLNYCLEQPGIDLITQSKVIRIDHSKNVVLENGQVIIANQAIVHATNAYAGEYLDFLRDKIIPIRGQCCSTKPMKTIFWEFGISEHDGYYHQSPSDGRITLGGFRWKSPDTARNNKNDSEINEIIKNAHETFLLNDIQALNVENHIVEVEHEWTGIMGFTIDHLPIVGSLPGDDTQFLLCGYNGNGNTNAFLCAKAIARMIAHDDPYKEGEEHHTVTFLKMFLPERFLNSSQQTK